MENFRCNGLSRSFDGVLALTDLDLALPNSGITAIIGPNGAGKTTLINILTGFIRPEAGHSYLGKRETTHLSPNRIARLGVARTFQDLRLILQVPVLDNIMLARPNQHGESLIGALFRIGIGKEEARNQNKAMGILEFVGLDRKAAELAGELSYGQQKLLTLACCLATEASILFLDEPIAGVQPNMGEKILDLIRKLCAEGKLIVFIEHDISAVREVADHLIVMDHGKVAVQGPPTEVLARPEIMEAYLA
jgi:branched-chain amino acid transport system ATP-binding protein